MLGVLTESPGGHGRRCAPWWIRVVELDGRGAGLGPSVVATSAPENIWFVAMASDASGASLLSWLDATSPTGGHRARVISATGALGPIASETGYVSSASSLSAAPAAGGLSQPLERRAGSTLASGSVMPAGDDYLTSTWLAPPLDRSRVVYWNWRANAWATRPLTIAGSTASLGSADLSLTTAGMPVWSTSDPGARLAPIGGTGYALTHHGGTVAGSRELRVWHRHVTSAGATSAVTRIDTADDWQEQATIASAPGLARALIAWTAVGTPPAVVGECDVRARVVDGSGPVGPPFVLHDDRLGCQARPRRSPPPKAASSWCGTTTPRRTTARTHRCSAG